jgi:hypothetical protein
MILIPNEDMMIGIIYAATCCMLANLMGIIVLVRNPQSDRNYGVTEDTTDLYSDHISCTVAINCNSECSLVCFIQFSYLSSLH